MKLNGDGGFELASGRTLLYTRGQLSMDLELGSGTDLYDGYDSGVRPHPIDYNDESTQYFTRVERQEIAEHMIRQWELWAAKDAP